MATSCPVLGNIFSEVRADRLVAIVLLLQVHGRMTAADLAERLEASERTIRRDLDALCVAGVPIYPQRGRGGGWTLIGGHRIDLSGLTADEAQALLLAADSGTGVLGPGFSEGLAAARRKVLAALPEGLRDRVGAAAGAVLVDRARWGLRHGSPPGSPTAGAGPSAQGSAETGEELTHLASLRRAVSAGRQAVIGYEPPGRPAAERWVHPLGLVCKRGVWYLVAATPAGLRSYRLSRVRSVRMLDDPVVAPDGFDLADAWAAIQQSLSERVPAPVVVEARVATAALRRLRATVGAWWSVEELGPVPGEEEPWTDVLMKFPTVAVAASELISLGEHIEIGSPPEVRAELAERGRRLLERYGPTAPANDGAIVVQGGARRG